MHPDLLPSTLTGCDTWPIYGLVITPTPTPTPLWQIFSKYPPATRHLLTLTPLLLNMKECCTSHLVHPTMTVMVLFSHLARFPARQCPLGGGGGATFIGHRWILFPFGKAQTHNGNHIRRCARPHYICTCVRTCKCAGEGPGGPGFV